MNTLDFSNENSLRAYPLKDGVTRTSNDGVFLLDNDLIVDMTVATSVMSLRLFISKIVNATDSLTITISGDDLVEVGTFYADLNHHTTGKDYYLVPTTAYLGATGKVTIWEKDGLLEQAVGEFAFDLAATELCSRVAVPCLNQASRISFVDTTGFTKTLTGNISLVAESNLRFRFDSSKLYIDAGDGLGLNKACTSLGVPIRSINGVAGDSQGDFVLIPADCAAFEEVPHGLMLTDTCAKPCVGCTELSDLTNRSAALESSLIGFKSFIDEMNTHITQLSTLTSYTYDCQDCN